MLGLSAAVLKTAAWVVFWNPASVTTFAERAAGLDEALVDWCGVDERGMPFRRPRTPEQLALLRRSAKASGTRVYGMTNNYVEPSGFDAARMSLMLNDPVRRKAHVAALLRIATEDRLAGWDLDYESLKADDRDEYTLFVRELATALHKSKRLLSVTVHPKLDDAGGWDGPKAQDYAAIGKAADTVRVMAYDYSWASGPPGPIAPDEWVRRVMVYARTRVPARKLSLGIPCYGYDWTTTPATSLTWADFIGRRKPEADNGRAPDSGEEAYGAITVQGGDKLYGPVRFAGAASFARKLALARELGLGGVSFWYVGAEDPGVWAHLKSRTR